MLRPSSLRPVAHSAAVPILILGLLALLAPLVALPAIPVAPAAPEVLVVTVKSAIHPVSAEVIADAIKEADRAGAAAVIVELDTAGGLMTSTRDITTAILGARTPVVVYVAPSGARAASAGFYILMSADVAAMAPGTNTGAAHPVGGQGEDIPGIMGKKVEEDSAANIRSLALRNGRDLKLAEAAVVQSRSFSAQEALDGKLIDLVAPDIPALVKALDGRTVKRGATTVTLHTGGSAVRNFEISPMRSFLGVLADPNITYLLLGLGSLGMLFELMHPGAILPGVVGAICLILAFYGLSVLPVSYAGLALLVLAMIFFILEIKVTSYGGLAVAGVICLVLGSLMLFNTPEPALRVSLELIAMLTAFTVLVVGFLVWMSLRARRLPVRTGAEGLIRETGVARSELAPRGKVFVHGELWDAEADEAVAAGEEVEIVAVKHLLLTVRPHRRRAT
ncbi:MAG TPA: nodulation protein NfeD [Thermoanaerobaculia bacterium]|jgi:membrane-bound serine protease (ClpP class)|nr:nodulation protein NfeD [Thermoanaerobaculia bacterium]